MKTYFCIIGSMQQWQIEKFQNVWMKSSIKLSLLVLSIFSRGKLYIILSSIVFPANNDCECWEHRDTKCHALRLQEMRESKLSFYSPASINKEPWANLGSESLHSRCHREVSARTSRRYWVTKQEGPWSNSHVFTPVARQEHCELC